MRGAFKGNIVVGNLPEGFTGEQLAALFDEHGLVLGARIAHGHSDPVQARRGLVALAPATAVEAAVRALNGQRVEEHKLKVRKVPERPPAPPKPRRAPRPAPPPKHAWSAAPATPRRKPVVEYRSLGARRPMDG